MGFYKITIATKKDSGNMSKIDTVQSKLEITTQTIEFILQSSQT